MDGRESVIVQHVQRHGSSIVCDEHRRGGGSLAQRIALEYQPALWPILSPTNQAQRARAASELRFATEFPRMLSLTRFRSRSCEFTVCHFPVPERLTDCGLFDPPSVIVAVAANEPTAVGENVKLIVQEV